MKKIILLLLCMSSVADVCLGYPIQYEVHQKGQLVRASCSEIVKGGLAVTFATWNLEKKEWRLVSQLVDKESGMARCYVALEALQADVKQRVEKYMNENHISAEG